MTDPKRLHLPPMFGGVSDGSVVWQRLGDIDHELLGYFLTCHLLIEHYMDEFLKARYPELDWDKPRLTFGQRANLLTHDVLVREPRYDPLPAIKHMNSLRNRISHRLEIRLDAESLQPLVDYMTLLVAPLKEPKLTDPREILSQFGTHAVHHLRAAFTP
jgi:hypothetical protein